MYYNHKIPAYLSMIPAIMILLVFFAVISENASGDFYIETEEYGSVLDYYGEYYLVNVRGNMTIINRYPFSLYAIRIPFNPTSLSVYSLDEDVDIAGNSIRISLLETNKSFTFEYYIYGIATEDPFSALYTNKQSALRDIIENTSITGYADMEFRLSKAELGSLETNRPLEIGINNPTQLEYNIRNLRIIKTEDENINNEIYHIDVEKKKVLYAYEDWSTFVIDKHSGLKESDVYWIYADLVPQNFEVVYNDSIDIDILDEGDIDDFPKEGTVVPEVGEVEPSSDRTRGTRVFLRKMASATRVFPGDMINITLIVTNLEQHSKVISLEDVLPKGFEFISAGPDMRRDEERLRWTLEVNKDTSKVVTYTIRFTDNSSVGMHYLPPAEASYDGKLVYSPKVPIIMKFVPEKKIYLQKSINYISSDLLKVTLVLRNMGETDIRDLILKEYLDDTAQFSEITVSPESKGLWEIPVLEKDEEWVVSYTTNEHTQADDLPSLFGIDDMYVLKTLIRENIVARYVMIPGVNVIEFVGLVVVILFPMLFFYLRHLKKKLNRIETQKQDDDVENP